MRKEGKNPDHTRPACSELSAIHAYNQSPTLVHLAHRIASTHTFRLLHIKVRLGFDLGLCTNFLQLPED